MWWNNNTMTAQLLFYSFSWNLVFLLPHTLLGLPNCVFSRYLLLSQCLFLQAKDLVPFSTVLVTSLLEEQPHVMHPLQTTKMPFSFRSRHRWSLPFKSMSSDILIKSTKLKFSETESQNRDRIQHNWMKDVTIKRSWKVLRCSVITGCREWAGKKNFKWAYFNRCWGK